MPESNDAGPRPDNYEQIMSKPIRYIKLIAPRELEKTAKLFDFFLNLCAQEGDGLVIHPQVGHARRDDFGEGVGDKIAMSLTNGTLNHKGHGIKLCAAHTISRHPVSQVYFAWWPLNVDLEKIEKKSWKFGVIACRDESDISFMSHKFDFKYI
jgi:hypothetical protein